ncbi:hypothetical protein ACQPU1_01345 [Clostridium paraputrificum]|uniref:hypothetical protein n=1 Tax=Clostridium paraputrificum TaxID=29363 RepID=UPI003D33830E
MSSSYLRQREGEKLRLVDILTNQQVENMNSLINKIISDIDTEIAKLYLKYSKNY